MIEFALFLMSFVLVLICYQIAFVNPAKKRRASKKKNNNKELIEIRYLEARYKLDLDKINYNQLLQLCAIISSFDIAVAVTIISMLDGLLAVLLGGFFIVVLLIIVSYHFVYLFYKRKGMIKDGNE